MTILAEHLAQADSWVLGAEHDVREFERQLAEADRDLATTGRQYNAATANMRAILGTGPDSVTFASDIDRQVAAYQAVTEARAAKATLRAGRQVVNTLHAKLANRHADLVQAQALRQRIELAMQADELPTAVDELEALLGLGPQ